MTKLFISITTITRLVFTQIKHPISVVLILLTQKSIACLTREQYTEDFDVHIAYP